MPSTASLRVEGRSSTGPVSVRSSPSRPRVDHRLQSSIGPGMAPPAGRGSPLRRRPSGDPRLSGPDRGRRRDPRGDRAIKTSPERLVTRRYSTRSGRPLVFLIAPGRGTALFASAAALMLVSSASAAPEGSFGGESILLRTVVVGSTPRWASGAGRGRILVLVRRRPLCATASRGSICAPARRVGGRSSFSPEISLRGPRTDSRWWKRPGLAGRRGRAASDGRAPRPSRTG